MISETWDKAQSLRDPDIGDEHGENDLERSKLIHTNRYNGVLAAVASIRTERGQSSKSFQLFLFCLH